MKPGRELDALVQQHIFGADVGDIYFDETHTEVVGRVPLYSTEMNDGWKIISKIVDGGHYVSLRCRKDTYIATVIVGQGDSRVRASVGSSSAPYSICLAALKAMGVEV